MGSNPISAANKNMLNFKPHNYTSYDPYLYQPSNNYSGYFRPGVPEPVKRTWVIAANAASYHKFLSMAKKSYTEYSLIPIIDNDMTLAQIFIANRGAPVIFLEGYQNHPAWDFIQNFIDIDNERIKP